MKTTTPGEDEKQKTAKDGFLRKHVAEWKGY